MKLKYLGLFALISCSCLVACNSDITTSSSNEESSSSFIEKTSTSNPHEIAIDEVYAITMEEGSPLDRTSPIILEGSVEDTLEEGKYYLGSTYAFTFSFYDINNDKKYVFIDESYLVYDKEYLQVIELSDAARYIPYSGKPTYYIKMLKAVDITSFSIILKNVSYTLDFSIIDFDENIDIYKRKKLERKLKDVVNYPGNVVLINSEEDLSNDPYAFYYINFLTENQRNAAYLANFSYLVVNLKAYTYYNCNYDTTFIGPNGNLVIRFRTKLSRESYASYDWDFLSYVFRIGKDYIDMDISIIFTSETDSSLFTRNG